MWDMEQVQAAQKWKRVRQHSERMVVGFTAGWEVETRSDHRKEMRQYIHHDEHTDYSSSYHTA